MNTLLPKYMALGAALFLSWTASFAQTGSMVLNPIGSYQSGVFDEGEAEIGSFDKTSKLFFFTNANQNSVGVLDLTDPKAPVLKLNIDMSSYGGGVNSVKNNGSIIAVAVEANVKQDLGKVVAFNISDIQASITANTQPAVAWQATVGALPDMLTFTPDGTKILVANEGEPNDAYSVDPEGSVSIITVSNQSVQTVGFSSENGNRAQLINDGVRIFGVKNDGTPSTVAEDLEPEYIAVSDDGTKAWVVMQENNAFAEIDIAAATLTKIIPLGTIDHSQTGFGIDASDRDGGINIANWPVKGFFMPDAITYVNIGGKGYILSANEGDAREYEDGEFLFAEEDRVKDLKLDGSVFTDATLQDNAKLGRLTVSTALPDTNANGEYRSLKSFGTRSFTIWDAETGAMVWDSGDDFETITAAFFPFGFNFNNDENPSFESRSDNKGPEPEAVNTTTIGDKTYAFIGLERVGGIMVYDITTPTAPVFITYTNNRDFSVPIDEDNATADVVRNVGDLGIEDIIVIPAADSPNGKDLIVTTNEVSGSVTIFETAMQSDANAFTLTILHNNDGESQVVDLGGELTKFGGVARFKAAADTLRMNATTDAVLMLSSGDNFLPGPEFSAGEATNTYYDALAIDAIDYDALAIGNHDFDFGPTVLADFISSISASKPPYLSSNLSFVNENEMQDLVDLGRVAKSTILTKAGTKIGVIGATTPELRQISSPGQTIIDPALTEAIQAEVDRMESVGVNKIILISHLQSIKEDSTLATTIRGVDVVIAGGGDEVLANSGTTLIPGDESEIYGNYPIYATDAAQKQVPIVTTKGSYSYIGKLEVTFDANGEVTVNAANSTPVAVDVDVFGEDATLKTNVVEPVVAYTAALATNVIATSEVVLDGRRNSVRTMETNQGNLIADALLWQANKRAAEFGVKPADIALQNGGGVRNDSEIAVGIYTELDTFDTLPFSNFVTIIEDIPVAQLKEIMENAVSRVEDRNGRFAQIAGMSVLYDAEEQPQVLNSDGTVSNPGKRIVSLILDSGEVLVQNGRVVDSEKMVSIATIDFLANGGDGYPYRGAEFTRVGTSYQRALFNYLTAPVEDGGLAGNISAAQYPEGGENRIITPEDFQSLADAKLEPVGTPVFAGGIVTRVLKRQFWVQDGSAGMVYFGGGTVVEDSIAAGNLAEGDMVAFYAKRADFNNLNQVSGNPGAFVVLERRQPLPQPFSIDLSEISEEYESRLVSISGLTFVDPDRDSLATSRNFTVQQGSDQITLRTASGSDDPFYEFERFVLPTGEFTFTGIIAQFNRDDANAGYQLTPINRLDIRAASEGFTLTVLHNNDGESQLLNAGSGIEDFGGIARFKTVADSLRFEASKKGGQLLLSSGDNFLAGPEFNLNFELEDNEPYLDAIALDYIGYDAFAIGNHDFDFGPDILARFISSFESDVPFLSANLDFSGEDTLQALVDRGRIASSIIVNAGGENVGIVGATTPNLDFISSPRNVVINDNVAAAVQAEVDALTSAGIDKIILISHLQGVKEDSLLATQLKNVDIMIAGGGDEVLANEGALLVPGDEIAGPYPIVAKDGNNQDLPIVTTAGNYKYVGRLEVNFNEAGIVTSFNGNPVRVAGGTQSGAVRPDRLIQEEVIPLVEAGLAALEANIIATTEVVLDGRRGSVRAVETNQGNLIADAMLWQAQQLADDFNVTSPLVGFQNGGGIRNDTEIAAGEITELDTFDMLPFSNFVTVVEGVTPQILRNVVENAVSAIGGSSGSGRFAQVSGLSFEYNPTQTPMNIEDGVITESGNRVITITLDDGTKIVENGALVAGAPTISVAIADFSAKGGDEYPFGDLDLTLLGVTYQRALYNYIVDGLEGTIASAQYPVGGEGRITETSAVSNEPGANTPLEFALSQNYPNPFNPTTSIKFDLAAQSNVRLEVFDMLGRKVATLVNETRAAGRYNVSFDASQLSSGLYMYRIQAGTFAQTRKMMLVK